MNRNLNRFYGKCVIPELKSGAQLGKVKVDLSAAKGELTVEWFDPTKGKSIEAGKTTGGVRRQFTAPFDGHAVLYLAS